MKTTKDSSLGIFFRGEILTAPVEDHLLPRFVNLTPHEVNVGELDLPTSGLVARVDVAHREVGHHAGVPLLVGSYGEVSNLPEPEDGVLYIVSAAVRTALPERNDLASPAHLVRDEEGRIIGCLAFEVNA